MKLSIPRALALSHEGIRVMANHLSMMHEDLHALEVLVESISESLYGEAVVSEDKPVIIKKKKRKKADHPKKDWSKAGKEARKQERLEILSELPQSFSVVEIRERFPKNKVGVWLAAAVHQNLIKRVSKGEYKKVA